MNRSPSFFARLALALRIVFSGELARRVFAALEGASAAELSEPSAALPEARVLTGLPAPAVASVEVIAPVPVVGPASAPVPASAAASAAAPAPATAPTPDASALGLLAILQREGRLIDFVEQDIDSYGDADVGAAARAVHAGCRKVLRGCCKLAPVRAEAEEARVVVEEGYDPRAIKLTGNLSGKPPYQGTLRHAGWRVSELALPKSLAGHDPHVVAPAEVEL